MPLGDAVHESTEGEISALSQPFEYSHLDKNMQHFTNLEVTDIHFVYKLTDGNARAAQGSVQRMVPTERCTGSPDSFKIRITLFVNMGH